MTSEETEAMTIQEAVERCIECQDENMPSLFNIYDETPGEIPGLLYGNCDMDSLVVHMFDLDVFNYDVDGIRKREMQDCLRPLVGDCQMVVDISVKKCTKEKRPKR